MEKEIKNYLENLVFKRFNDKQDLLNKLKKDFKDSKVSMEVASYCQEDLVGKNQYDDMLDFDWSYVGTIENDNMLCDFDIYYAKTRENKENGIMITEVGYEFE